MAVLQKAVTPGMVGAYLERGYDRVAGFVVDTADVAWATTPAQVFAAHGLGFPGSPFSPAAPFVDVLRFAPARFMRVEAATGGTDVATRDLTGGTFIDRPPFTGNGFVAVEGHVVPLWWTAHTRIPAGTQLARLGADGSSVVLARYADVAQGWVGEAAPVSPPSMPLSRHVGLLAGWQGVYWSADLMGEEVVLAAAQPPPAEAGFTPTAAGRWRRTVPAAQVGELFELWVEGTWNGLRMRVVDQYPGPDGQVLDRVSYVGHDADLAEAMRLEKVDAAVYEATVPHEALTDLLLSQLTAQ